MRCLLQILLRKGPSPCVRTHRGLASISVFRRTTRLKTVKEYFVNTGNLFRCMQTACSQSLRTCSPSFRFSRHLLNILSWSEPSRCTQRLLRSWNDTSTVTLPAKLVSQKNSGAHLTRTAILLERKAFPALPSLWYPWPAARGPGYGIIRYAGCTAPVIFALPAKSRNLRGNLSAFFPKNKKSFAKSDREVISSYIG